MTDTKSPRLQERERAREIKRGEKEGRREYRQRYKGCGLREGKKGRQREGERETDGGERETDLHTCIETDRWPAIGCVKRRNQNKKDVKHRNK